MPTFIPVSTREEAVKAAKKHLESHSNLSGGNYYELPDGTKLRVRSKDARTGRLAAENYNTKANADTKRSKGETTYTTDAARDAAAKVRKQAREQSQSTLHRHAHGNRQSIGEHAQDIASGGIGDDLDSVSDPYFKDFKDTVASKVRAKYGDQYVVDINDVTGYLRVIPRQYYNKHQYRSQQPGFDVEPDMDIDQVVRAGVNKFTRSDAIAEILKARATKAAGKLIPGLDLAISAAEVASYAQMGRFDQAALAGLSGIIGFVPGGGDLIAAGIDGYNGVLDVQRYDGTSAGGASFANGFDSLRTSKIRGRSGAVKGA